MSLFNVRQDEEVGKDGCDSTKESKKIRKFLDMKLPNRQQLSQDGQLSIVVGRVSIPVKVKKEKGV